MQSKISIIVPVYKVEQYLRQCIDSIILQTYTNLEIILIDDGSPDNCGKICDEYAQKDNRIIVIHKENDGVSSARNDGLDIATGEYISFIDSDDYADIDMMQVLVENVISNDVDLIICGYNRVFKADIKIHSCENMLFNSLNELENLFIYYCYKAGIIYSPCNKLYKKILCGKFNTEIHYGEDRLFNYDYIKKCRKVSIIDNALYNYRYNNDSVSTNYRDNFVEINILLIEALNKFCVENFSSSFDIYELLSLLYAEVNGMLYYCIYHKISYKKSLSKIKEIMNNKKVIDIIEKYKPKKFNHKISHFLAKNKLAVLFTLLAKFIYVYKD